MGGAKEDAIDWYLIYLTARLMTKFIEKMEKKKAEINIYIENAKYDAFYLRKFRQALMDCVCHNQRNNKLYRAWAEHFDEEMRKIRTVPVANEEEASMGLSSLFFRRKRPLIQDLSEVESLEYCLFFLQEYLQRYGDPEGENEHLLGPREISAIHSHHAYSLLDREMLFVPRAGWRVWAEAAKLRLIRALSRIRKELLIMKPLLWDLVWLVMVAVLITFLVRALGKWANLFFKR